MMVVASALWGVAICSWIIDSLVLSLVPRCGLILRYDLRHFPRLHWNQTIQLPRGFLAGIEMMRFTGPFWKCKMALREKWGVKVAPFPAGIMHCCGCRYSVILSQFFRYDGREGVKQREREEAERRVATRF
jgi:hypothetical protein